MASKFSATTLVYDPQTIRRVRTATHEDTKHTFYQIPRGMSIPQAVERIQRFKPNAYGIYVESHWDEGVIGRRSQARQTRPIDPDSPNLIVSRLQELIKKYVPEDRVTGEEESPTLSGRYGIRLVTIERSKRP